MSKTQLAPRVATQLSAATNLDLVEDPSLRAGTALSVVIRDQCSEPGVISSEILRGGADRGLAPTKSGSRSYRWILNREMSKKELSAAAEGDACVEIVGNAISDQLATDFAAVGDQTLPDDPKISLERHLFSIGAPEAYKTFYNRNTGITQDVVIAVIDSGVRIDHEDLKANVWVNDGEIPRNGIDDDRNGYIDDVNGYNFASDIASPMPQPTSANSSWQWAHGTRVAGLAAATAFNHIGGAGVAANAKIMALNVMGRSNSMEQSDTANAVRYAIDNGADVINLSLGGNEGLTADLANQLRRATSKGIVVFAAAGNESSAIGANYSAAGLAPTVPGLISVGNIQGDTQMISTTSNYSNYYVKLAAPGTNSMSNLLYTTSPESSSSYGYFSGTSAATPVAAGAAALAIGLVKSRGYSVSAAAIEKLMLASAKKIAALKGYFRDGNTLDLAGLARAVDRQYPKTASAVGKIDPAPASVQNCSGT